MCIHVSDTVHTWKIRFAVSCLTPVLRYFFGVKKSSYAELLELDGKIRQLTPSDHLIAPMDFSRSDWSLSSDPSKAIQQYTAVAVIESSQFIPISQIRGRKV